jgi:hypothetical protein
MFVALFKIVGERIINSLKKVLQWAIYARGHQSEGRQDEMEKTTRIV